MSANPLTTSSGEYFPMPAFNEDSADQAYRQFVIQGAESGADFGHLLEASAWQQQSLSGGSPGGA